MRRLLGAIGLPVLLLLLCGCTSTPMTDQLLSNRDSLAQSRVLLSSVPFFPQQQYQCGPAALATVLAYHGANVRPQALVRKVYIPERKGSLQVEMVAAVRSFQFLPYVDSYSIDDLLATIEHGQPVLVLQNLGVSWYPNWHYSVVVGYDLDRAEIILRSGTTRDYTVAMKTFERTWARADYWALQVLSPGQAPLKGDAGQYFIAAAALEPKLAAESARSMWLAGVERWPDNIMLHMGYGNFLYGQGASLAAQDQYRYAIQQQADYAPALNNLAQALVDQGDVRQALDYARRAAASDDNPVYRQTLFDIESRLNKQAN